MARPGPHEVVVLDNLATGRPENLAGLLPGDAVRVVKVDVADHEAILPHFEGVGVVFHLAALADIVPSISEPLCYHRANVDGTVSVLEAARVGGARRIVYAASSSCYGIPDHYPTPEDAPICPQYPYALTKWIGEQFLLHWGKVYGLSKEEVFLHAVLSTLNTYDQNLGYAVTFCCFQTQITEGRSDASQVLISE